MATRHAADLTWKGAVALRDAVKEVASRKLEDGPALVTQGSIELVHALLGAGLVDEIRVFTFPVLLGRGKRLFDESRQPRGFELRHSVASPHGLIRAVVRPGRRGEDRHHQWGEGTHARQARPSRKAEM